MLFWCPFLDPHPTVYHSNICVRLRSCIKSSTFTLFMKTLWSGWMACNVSKGHNLCPLHNHIFHVTWLGRPSHGTCDNPFVYDSSRVGGAYLLHFGCQNSILLFAICSMGRYIFLWLGPRCPPLWTRPPPMLPKVYTHSIVLKLVNFYFKIIWLQINIRGHESI